MGRLYQIIGVSDIVATAVSVMLLDEYQLQRGAWRWKDMKGISRHNSKDVYAKNSNG